MLKEKGSEGDKLISLEKKLLLLPVDIRCPKDTPRIKWLAAQTPAVIELAKELWKQIRPFCTEKSCKRMVAGKYEYQWKHHPRSKKPRSCPAHYYLKMMFQWLNQQKHIFEMEQMRYERLVRHLSDEDRDRPMFHPVFRERTVTIAVVDYLHDPFYYLTGIWAKAFSVFAHVFCEHFGTDRNEEISPEVKGIMENAFERFMRFVKGYHLLSSRRLAPLDKRIALLDFRSVQPSSPVVSPRESKSVLYEKNKFKEQRPSFVGTPSVLRNDDSRSMLLSPDDFATDRSLLLPSSDKDKVTVKRVAEKKGSFFIATTGSGGGKSQRGDESKGGKDEKDDDGGGDPEAMSGAEYNPENDMDKNGVDDSDSKAGMISSTIREKDDTQHSKASKASKSSLRPGDLFSGKDGDREFELTPLKEEDS